MSVGEGFEQPNMSAENRIRHAKGPRRNTLLRIIILQYGHKYQNTGIIACIVYPQYEMPQTGVKIGVRQNLKIIYRRMTHIYCCAPSNGDLCLRVKYCLNHSVENQHSPIYSFQLQPLALMRTMVIRYGSGSSAIKSIVLRSHHVSSGTISW